MIRLGCMLSECLESLLLLMEDRFMLSDQARWLSFASIPPKISLMTTPILDDNVFFEDSVRLIQRLIELEKEDWRIASYPVQLQGSGKPGAG